MSERVRANTPKIEWNKIAGLRGILIHEYFGNDGEIVWDIAQHKLPHLETAVKQLLTDPA